MESGDAATWVAAGTAIVAAGVAIWQSIEARKAATSSAANADRSVKAAETSASAHTQIADAASFEATKGARRWQIEVRGKQSFTVRNETGRTAYDVVVSDEPESGLVMRRNREREEVIQYGEEFTFSALTTYGTQDNRVTVTWHAEPDLSDERMTFRVPLPRCLD